ncbi:MAG: ATP-binding protein [Alphaproteobacteria bacterium]
MKVLLLEDSAADAELIERSLRKAGLSFSSRHVDNREGFVRALEEFAPDLVLSDYDVTDDFDGLAAVQVVREARPDLPVIIVTGAVGDETAVQLVKAGASDYILKDRLGRLPIAIERALAEVEEARARARTEEANAKLKDIDRLKSMFIASMSHELRTPLNTIIGFTGIMLQGLAGPVNDEQRKQLTMVRGSAEHLLALINDVIDVSKIEAGLVEISVEVFDMVDLVAEVTESFTVAAGRKGLELVEHQLPPPRLVRTDRRRVRQILVNLLGNAIKFTDHGRIAITHTATDAGTEIAVEDSGIGIGRDDLDRIFDAFSQIHTDGRAWEGTGLGLYLSRKIAALLGGAITVRSEIGTGSAFTLSLPAATTRPHDEENPGRRGQPQ